MDLTNRPGAKTQAGARPANRAQKRGASRGGPAPVGGAPTQKRNSGIADGVAYMSNQTKSSNTKTTRVSEAGTASMYKNVPVSGRASVQFDPSKKMQDMANNFYVHKRGGGESSRGPKQPRTRSNDQADMVGHGGK